MKRVGGEGMNVSGKGGKRRRKEFRGASFFGDSRD